MTTRRQILQTAVAPMIVPSLVLGQRAGVVAPSDKVVMGAIGIGSRGAHDLSKILANPAARFVAICDVRNERRETVKSIADKQYGDNGCKMYDDQFEILARQDIDAVAIATPDHWHVPLLAAAARAGKDVYVEKPLSPTIGQNMIARKAIRETGRVFQYGTQQRGATHVRLGCELVRGGRIGKLTAVEVVSPSGGGGGSTATGQPPPGFDYEMWQGPAPQRPFREDACVKTGHWHISDYSIGFLGGWGAHTLDVLDWGLPTPMVPVEYEGKGIIPKVGLYDTVMKWDVRCTYANGLPMTFRTGPDSTKFIGEEGSIQIMRKGIDSEPKSLIGSLPPPTPFVGMGRNHVRNFLDSIRRQATPESHIDTAFRSDLISHLSNIAVRMGRKIRWDPASETIVRDEEAAKLMRRPARKPWDKLL